MTKRALSAVAGFLSLCLPLFAQQTQSKAENLKPEGTAAGAEIFSALNNSISLPSLTLADRHLFSFSGAIAPPLSFNWMDATPDFLPALSTTEKPQRANAAVTPPRDSSKEVVEVRRSNLFDYAHGEVGFLYGRSTGKYGVEVEQGYFIGEVGNDKFHITAGAAYENSSGRFPRFKGDTRY